MYENCVCIEFVVPAFVWLHAHIRFARQTNTTNSSVRLYQRALLCYAMYISHTYGIMNMHNVESGRGRGSSSTNIKYLSMCNFFFFCVMKYGIFALCCCLFFIDMLLRDGIILVGLEDPLRLAPTESCGGRGYGILCVMHRPHYNLVVAILLCVVCAQIFASQS